MKTADFDYHLPPELIAQTPLEPRDHSRLLVVNRASGTLEHRRFFEIPNYLRAGDVLVFNDSRVIPARMKGRLMESGRAIELLLLKQLEPLVWETLAKPGKLAKEGTQIVLASANQPGLTATAKIIGSGADGSRIIKFADEPLLMQLGEIPLPPYIKTRLDNPERYQTVYSQLEGSVAAPTAGLHFTPELLHKIKQMGVKCVFATLHIGLDTFRPVREETPLEHKMHSEYGFLSKSAAAEISMAKMDGRRVICIGTTAVRLLEAAAQVNEAGYLQEWQGWINLFILPGYKFKVMDGLVTNFHLPRSTLLMLVTAFAGQNNITNAYREAILNEYRFYSFGDATFII